MYSVLKKYRGGRMDNSVFLSRLTQTRSPNPEGNVFDGIWSEYEKIVLCSLITSFGLDFLVADQRSGDVDTLWSVRDTSVRIEERYKKPEHRSAYEGKGAYDPKAYHTDPRYVETVRLARQKYNET